MTAEQFEPDCNDSDNQYDYSLLNSRYEANVEKNEIIEWNKDACNAQYTDLERIAEKLNFKQMQLEECRKGYEKLYKENEQLKKQWKEKRHEDINELSVIAMRYKALEKENEQLKEQLSEAKADEKQLGISFMGYKMKLIEVLQKKYDKVKGKTLYADVYTEIAEEMGVDLE